MNLLRGIWDLCGGHLRAILFPLALCIGLAFCVVGAVRIRVAGIGRVGPTLAYRVHLNCAVNHCSPLADEKTSTKLTDGCAKLYPPYTVGSNTWPYTPASFWLGGAYMPWRNSAC